MKKITNFVLLILLNIIFLTGCTITPGFSIANGDRMILTIGSSVQLNINNTTGLTGEYTWDASNDCVTLDDGYVTAVKAGIVVITASFNEYTDSITITVREESNDPIKENISLELRASKSEIKVGEELQLDVSVTPASYLPLVEIKFISGENFAAIDGVTLIGKSAGPIVIVAYVENVKSREVFIEIIEEKLDVDPYENVDKATFYANYTEATSYKDAYYRTLHGLMSGSIAEQDQEPTLSSYQPKENGKLIKNSTMLYSNDGNTYYIVNAYGEIVDQVFKGGAYVTLEEVAAYVFAFGEIPANHSSSKRTKPTESIWGEYLRVNHTEFSGSTSRYPYEPALPNINGNGGELQYYEMDLGTTGTDCDPSYDIREYNNGYSIERGAARIVYARFDKNNNHIIDINEKYVFYTYNHYNDFQEYLNYQGGWGEIFGNITGGGTLSSKYDYNPTAYNEVVLKSLTTTSSALSIGAYNSNSNYVILEELTRKYY